MPKASNQEKNEEEWEDQTGNIWKIENEGDTIKGKVVSIKKGKFDWNNYQLETEDGIFTVFGSSVLQNRMAGIEEGDTVKIVFQGLQKNKAGQDMKMFQVLKLKKAKK